jgi:hypothetical protein
MPSELDIFLSLPRHVRRALSRDQSRKLPIPPLPPRHDAIAERVNAPHRMPVQPSRRSGQQRINAKRNQRAEYWRQFEAATERHPMTFEFTVDPDPARWTKALNEELDRKFGPWPFPRV